MREKNYFLMCLSPCFSLIIIGVFPIYVLLSNLILITGYQVFALLVTKQDIDIPFADLKI